MSRKIMDFAPRTGGVAKTGVKRSVGVGVPTGKPVTRAGAPVRKSVTGVAKARPGVKPKTSVKPRTEVKPVTGMKPGTRVRTAGKSGVRTQAARKPEVARKPGAGTRTARVRTKTGVNAGVKARAKTRIEPEVPNTNLEIALRMDSREDPLERPISEFADLEQLAHEIEEVTGGGVVVEEETEFVARENEFSLKSMKTLKEPGTSGAEPRFGVVEDFQPRFVNTEVEKRPLSGAVREAQMVQPEQGSMTARGRAKRGKNEVRTRMTEEMGVGATAGLAQPGINSAAARTAAAKRTKMQIPKTRFINQNKVVKRPLSQTAYSAGMAGPRGFAGPGMAAEQGGSMGRGGTGVIASGGTGQSQKGRSGNGKTGVQIAKPNSKGSALGMTLAILATIILGAVVGTVAFLLLPR